jgi:hypothetical protein
MYVKPPVSTGHVTSGSLCTSKPQFRQVTSRRAVCVRRNPSFDGLRHVGQFVYVETPVSTGYVTSGSLCTSKPQFRWVTSRRAVLFLKKGKTTSHHATKKMSETSKEVSLIFL